MSELQAFQHPRFARMYERIGAEADRRGSRGHRQWMLLGLSGRVIEVGAGNGLNFSQYPETVDEVLAVEPENRLRDLAERAATEAPVRIRVVPGHAEALPASDDSFDAAVASLVLCSVPDPVRALAEMRRVLRPGGELRFYEHVRSNHPWAGKAEDLVAPLWKHCGGGCHPNRPTADTIAAAGFEVLDLDRFSFRPMRFGPTSAHILGRARNPG